jgi:hypothetical protein
VSRKTWAAARRRGSAGGGFNTDTTAFSNAAEFFDSRAGQGTGASAVLERRERRLERGAIVARLRRRLHRRPAPTVAQSIAEPSGQAIVVDNWPSTGSIVASQEVANAAADGYTVLLTSNFNTVSESLFKKLPFNSTRDLAPVAQSSRTWTELFNAPFQPSNLALRRVLVPRKKAA